MVAKANGTSAPYRTEEIGLGDIVKDTITGFEGVAIARTLWLNNCDRITIQPQELKDGKPIEAHTFDIDNVVVVKKKVVPVNNTHGGPRSAPSRSKDPR